jgi:hypothetical protein
MAGERIIIVGGPRCGKSTLAREYRARGIPTFCGDPASKVKDHEDDVTYLPEGLDFAGDSGGAAYISDHWFNAEGPWLCEGHVMARALRRWVEKGRAVPRDWKIIVLASVHPEANATPRQVSMGAGVMTVWEEIAHLFHGQTEEYA